MNFLMSVICLLSVLSFTRHDSFVLKKNMIDPETTTGELINTATSRVVWRTTLHANVVESWSKDRQAVAISDEPPHQYDRWHNLRIQYWRNGAQLRAANELQHRYEGIIQLEWSPDNGK